MSPMASSLLMIVLFVGSFAIVALPCIDSMALVYACDIYGTSPVLTSDICMVHRYRP